MRHVCLGPTGLEVSSVSLGTWAFGADWGIAEVEESAAAIHRALDLGITLFDTADGQGSDAAERLLGRVLRQRVRRQDVVIAARSAGTRLRAGVEASLRNLGTDYLDLYQVHRRDPHTSAEEIVGAVEELVVAGKVRHFGVADADLGELAAFLALGWLETVQSSYHMFDQRIEDEILPYAARHGIGVLASAPLAHGLLSGLMTSSTTFAADDWRGGSADFAGENFALNLRVMARLTEFARDRGVALPQLAVAWTLANPAVDVAIVRARRGYQVDRTAAAADLHLTATELRELDAILAHAMPMRASRQEGT